MLLHLPAQILSQILLLELEYYWSQWLLCKNLKPKHVMLLQAVVQKTTATCCLPVDASVMITGENTVTVLLPHSVQSHNK